MRFVVLGLRNAVRCEIWCYGDMVIWPALQARAFALVLYLIVYCIHGRRRSKRRRLCGSVGMAAGLRLALPGRPSTVGSNSKKKDESMRHPKNYTGICRIKFYISCELFCR